MSTEGKIDKLNRRIARLRHKIYKQQALLANYQIYGKTPPWFYLNNLATWQEKVKSLTTLRDFYKEELEH